MFAHFFIGRLTEIRVRTADSNKRIRAEWAHDLVGRFLELFASFGWRGRYRDDQPPWILLPDSLDSSLHSGACGRPIVDNDDCPALNRWSRPVAAVQPFAPLEFSPLAFRDGINGLLGYAELAKDPFVQYSNASGLNSRGANGCTPATGLLQRLDRK